MIQWTKWQPLGESFVFSPEQLAETLDGGQAFRWSYDPQERLWQGVWGGHVVRIHQSDTNGELLASAPVSSPASVEELRLYLGQGVDWAALLDALPWRSDPHLARCLQAFPGLRLLQQPFAETVLCFLCSATKQIPQIKIMCERLATSLGMKIAPGIHALPTWEQVAGASEAELRALGLGFRAKNIKKTADLIAAESGMLSAIEAAPYAEAKARLTALAGIGEKIADCALLFGAGKLEAFPVDTWIIKVLEKRYNLTGWTPAQLSQFGRVHFGQYAGFAQQFLFSYERSSTAR